MTDTKTPQGMLGKMVRFLTGFNASQSIDNATAEVVLQFVLPTDCHIIRFDYSATLDNSYAGTIYLDAGGTTISDADVLTKNVTNTSSAAIVGKLKEYAAGTIVTVYITGSASGAVAVTNVSATVAIQPIGSAAG